MARALDLNMLATGRGGPQSIGQRARCTSLPYLSEGWEMAPPLAAGGSTILSRLPDGWLLLALSSAAPDSWRWRLSAAAGAMSAARNCAAVPKGLIRWPLAATRECRRSEILRQRAADRMYHRAMHLHIMQKYNHTRR